MVPSIELAPPDGARALITVMKTLETLCHGGTSFEDALEAVGMSDSPIQFVAMLEKYWRVLQMEYAHAAARIYYDKLLEGVQ